jgi:hypothetical protein
LLLGLPGWFLLWATQAAQLAFQAFDVVLDPLQLLAQGRVMGEAFDRSANLGIDAVLEILELLLGCFQQVGKDAQSLWGGFLVSVAVR